MSSLETKDAVTPSEKIRAIIKDARDRKEQGNSPDRLMDELHGQLQDLQRNLSVAERPERVHSEFLRFVLDWQNQFAQSILFAGIGDEAKVEDLQRFEDDLADQVFRLIDYIARLGVTPKAPCYNSALIRDKLLENMDLLHLVETQVEKGESNG
ncbi:MAG: hypothetical protein AAF441_14300 [Pseudomonadota bacterium]